jgi:hypothetical protein
MGVRLYFVLIVFAVLGNCLTTQAQSQAELVGRYGPALESYEIRPHIVMTVKYSQDNQVYEYVIEGRHHSKNNIFSEPFMSWKLVEELIDEVAPPSQRGAHRNSRSFNAGCSGMGIRTYERVEVVTLSTCPRPGQSPIASVVIRWVGRLPKE